MLTLSEEREGKVVFLHSNPYGESNKTWLKDHIYSKSLQNPSFEGKRVSKIHRKEAL
jgi:hypothetical protein